LSLQADKILALTNAAGVEVEAIWATLLEKALAGKNIKELLSNVGSGGGAPAVGGAAPAAGGAAAAAEAPKEEEKPEEKEESDDDMVRLLSSCGTVVLANMISHDHFFCTTAGLRTFRLICFPLVYMLFCHHPRTYTHKNFLKTLYFV